MNACLDDIALQAHKNDSLNKVRLYSTEIFDKVWGQPLPKVTQANEDYPADPAEGSLEDVQHTLAVEVCIVWKSEKVLLRNDSVHKVRRSGCRRKYKTG